MTLRAYDLVRKTLAYWRKHGSRATLGRLRRELSGAPPPVPFTPHVAAPTGAPTEPARAAAPIPLEPPYASATAPLKTYLRPVAGMRRISVITDSIAKGHMYGGVGTAMILATLLANRLGANLRIITRHDRAQPDQLDHVLSVYGLAIEHETEFAFMPLYDRQQEIDLVADELFITTSWWTTAACMDSIPRASIVYLLQEDERMFYPFSDERLRCDGVLSAPDIRFVVNTRLLFDHLLQDKAGNIGANGICFEPAFPHSVYHPRERLPGGKKKFIFYARPNNLRNLFFLGLQVIRQAIANGSLDLAEWDVVFLGKEIPEVDLGGGVVPQRLENLSWAQYADLAGSADLALCLMYTPHPSYPPLDFVASGAVAVTNQYANKRDLSNYSRNLLCAPLELDALVQAMKDGVALAGDAAQRQRNFEANGLLSDWRQALGSVVDHIGGAA